MKSAFTPHAPGSFLGLLDALLSRLLGRSVRPEPVLVPVTVRRPAPVRIPVRSR